MVFIITYSIDAYFCLSYDLAGMLRYILGQLQPTSTPAPFALKQKQPRGNTLGLRLKVHDHTRVFYREGIVKDYPFDLAILIYLQLQREWQRPHLSEDYQANSCASKQETYQDTRIIYSRGH